MSVKIDLNSSRVLQEIVLNFKKIPGPEHNKMKTEFISDLKNISEDSKNLKDIDPQRSAVEFVNNRINFNLVYCGIAQLAFSVDGSINKEEKTLEINFKYEFEREDAETENGLSKRYLFTLNLMALYDETPSYGERIGKEEILRFIRETVNRIFDGFNDELKTLRTVTLNRNNLEELAGIESGGIAEMVQSVIGAVISFAKFRELNNPDNEKAAVVLRPVRSGRIIKEFSIKKITAFSAEIKENEGESDKRPNALFL
jgi:hypothetical protein